MKVRFLTVFVLILSMVLPTLSMPAGAAQPQPTGPITHAQGPAEGPATTVLGTHSVLPGRFTAQHQRETDEPPAPPDLVHAREALESAPLMFIENVGQFDERARFQVRGDRLEPGATASAGITTRVSVASDGTQGNGNSSNPSISSDGRYVAFHSGATSLVPGDTNGHSDVFVHDRQTGQTTRVSVASDGSQGNKGAGGQSISADGRYVAFHSTASNLVPGDTNSTGDVFAHDRETGQTTRVHVASDGTEANGYSDETSISADGRYVIFASWASNLVSDDTNGRKDIFVHDRQTGQTIRVSVASDGAQGNHDSYHVSISVDGRYVAFGSVASNLVPGDSNSTPDVFVHDRQTGQTTRVSVASDGTQGDGNSGFRSLFIVADGRYVAFTSSAGNLVSDDTNGHRDVFVHDRQTGQTTRVSVASDATQGNDASGWGYLSISGDGRYVAFESWASNLVGGDTNGAIDVFVRDRQTDQTTRVSVSSDGAEGNVNSYHLSLSADGRNVAFTSWASLVPDDTNVYSDVYVHDRGAGYGTFLQLPFDPQDPDHTKLGESCRGTTNGLGECQSAYFDHHYPTGSDNADWIFRPFWGADIDSFNQPCDTQHHPEWCYDGHEGHDYRLVEGTLVRAAAAGIAHCERDTTGYGYSVLIDHGNGYSTRYAHLQGCEEFFGGSDKSVTAGDPVGRVALTGKTTGYHLHFGVYHSGEVVDPWGWNARAGDDPWEQTDPSTRRSVCLWEFGCDWEGYLTIADGGTTGTPDGRITASAPPGAVDKITILRLTLSPDPVAQPSAVPADYSFDLSAQDIYGNAVETFLQPLAIVINYAEDVLAYVVETSLTLQSWDVDTEAWQALPTTLDLHNNTATATTNDLSLFTLLGEPQNPAPTIASVNPNSGYSYPDTEITIEGTGFLPTPSVRLGLNELPVTFVNSITLTAVVPSDLDPGVYTLTVANPDGQAGSLESAFTVREEYNIYLPLILRNN